VLDGVVSAMKTVRKWRRWEEMKNVEQWCFSIGKTDERLLVTVFQQREGNERLLVFQQREGNERLLVFQQREKLLLMVFQQWKGEKRNKCWTELFREWGNGGLECFWKWEEMKSAEQRCFSVGKKVTSVSQRCFSIVKNQRCCTAVFQHREKLSL
jgi:hypothetical protein